MMNRRVCTLFLLGLAVVWGTGPAKAQKPKKPARPALVAPTEHLSPEEERAAFHLPPGFEAQLVVSEPQINKPVNLAFDDRGRLWVSSTREYPFPAKGEGKPRDKVVVLDDFGPDGKARKVSVFADGLNMPYGILPLGDGSKAIVYSIPDIWLLTDSDGDGKADQRKMLYFEYGFRDTHGMTNAFTLALDGWVYACHGFSNTSTVQGADGQAVTMQSGNTYRFRLDGSHLEQWTWGQVNPFGLVFDPDGNLYSCDCHTKPLYQLLRGAYYPSFGKPHDGLGFGPEIMTHDHGSTAIAGILSFDADSFPPSFQGRKIVGNVVTNRINQDRLEFTGSTPKAIEQPDFLVSDDPWFRPVDLELGPDGAIYVADFYNRIIGHYEVPLTHPGRDRESGRIWRIVYKGDDAKHTPAPHGGDFTKASVDELVGALGHPDLAVRTRATNMLAARGDEVVDPVAKAVGDPEKPLAWVHGLWVLHRLKALGQDDLKAAARAGDRRVRVHVMRVLAERPELEGETRQLAVSALSDSDPLVRRCAADALGRHPRADNLRPLLDARHSADPKDTHLVHVIRMALRDTLKEGSAWPMMNKFTSGQDRETLADVAAGVPSVEVAKYLLDYLPGTEDTIGGKIRFIHWIARHGDAGTDKTLLEEVRKQSGGQMARAARIKAVQQGLQERGAKPPSALRSWAREVAMDLIGSTLENETREGITLARSMKLVPATEPLEAIVLNRPDEQTRLAAVEALAEIQPSEAVGPLGQVLVEPRSPAQVRDRCAQVLARLNRDDARSRLVEALPVAPARLQGVIAASLAQSKPGAEALLDTVEQGKASARLLQDRAVRTWLEQSHVEKLDQRLEKLTSGLAPVDEAMQAMLNRRREQFTNLNSDADVEKGRQVFSKVCSACHQLSGEGAQIGPQLDGVGVRGPDRLMEDILDPNRNVDQAFRMTTLALDDGRILSGLLLNDEGEIFTLADSQGQEIRVPKDSVEERKISPLSPMPANLADQIEEPAFYDLIGYLLTKKEGRPVEGGDGRE